VSPVLDLFPDQRLFLLLISKTGTAMPVEVGYSENGLDRQGRWAHWWCRTFGRAGKWKAPDPMQRLEVAQSETPGLATDFKNLLMVILGAPKSWRRS